MEKLQNVILRSYRFPDQDPEKVGEIPDLNAGFLLEAKHYDANGNLFRQEEFNADGTINESNEYVFNDKGTIIEHSHFIQGELTEKLKLEHSANGDILREERIFQEGGIQQAVYTYSADGLLLKKLITDEEGTEEGSEEYIYQNGNLISRKVRDLLMETGEDYEMKYKQVEDKWILEEEIHVEIPAGYVYRTVFYTDGYVTYDAKGSKYASHRKVLNDKGLLAEAHFNSMSRDVSSFYSYDEAGRMIEELKKVGDNVNYIARFVFEESGKLKYTYVTEASAGAFTDIFVLEKKA